MPAGRATPHVTPSPADEVITVRHVSAAYAQWGRVQMADAEAKAAPRPEMQRLVAALRARLWQLQTELREQEVSEASSRAYCRGFCQVGAGQR